MAVQAAVLTTTDWAEIPEYEQQNWLINGLITSDDNLCFVGKPKSGKSTGIRNLIAAIILGGKYLSRSVNLPGRGRVLYLHLDRKDRPHQIKRELRNLGVIGEKNQLRFLTEKDVPKKATNDQLCNWLARHAQEFNPHLIVIDLFTNFMKCKKGVADYDGMQDAITLLQDSLAETGYKGVLGISLHARKAVTDEDVFDNILVTTSIRGCMSTGLMFRLYKKQKLYTVQSDQTHRDPVLGELEEMVVNRDAIGVTSLGTRFEELKKEEKRDVFATRLNKVFKCIANNPNLTDEELEAKLEMSSKTFIPLRTSLEEAGRIAHMGEGKKGDPKRYFIPRIVFGKPDPVPYVPQCRECTDPVLPDDEFCATHRAEHDATEGTCKR